MKPTTLRRNRLTSQANVTCQGSPKETRELNGSSALYRAAFLGDEGTVRELIKDPRNISDRGSLMLTAAIRQGHLNVVKLLMGAGIGTEKGAIQIGSYGLSTGNNVLHVALEKLCSEELSKGHLPPVAKYFLKLPGAMDLMSETNQKGQTPVQTSKVPFMDKVVETWLAAEEIKDAIQGNGTLPLQENVMAPSAGPVDTSDIL